MTRRPRKRRRSRRSAQAWRNAGWIGLCALVLAVIIGGMAFWSSVQPEEIDEDLCPAKNGPVAGLAILIDLTDPLSKVQHERLQSLFKHWIDKAAHNTLITVGAVEAETEGNTKTFALCKPLEGDEANKLYQNPKMVGEKYRRDFLLPFEKIISGMLNAQVADSSPIMESLQALLVNARDFADATYPRNVIIVSDLLQNSEAFSFYRGGTWRTFMRSPHVKRLGKHFEGVVVTVCRVPRIRTGIDMDIVEDFWVNYFKWSGDPEAWLGTHSKSPFKCNLGDL